MRKGNEEKNSSDVATGSPGPALECDVAIAQARADAWKKAIVVARQHFCRCDALRIVGHEDDCPLRNSRSLVEALKAAESEDI
jgi:hypothetical protein